MVADLLLPLNLASLFEVNADGPNRKVLVQQPSLKVMHVTLATGQVLPPHKHPGCYVFLHGLWGTTTVQLEQEDVFLPPQHLLSFSGEMQVSPRNDGDAACALLITLVKQVVSNQGEK